MSTEKSTKDLEEEQCNEETGPFPISSETQIEIKINSNSVHLPGTILFDLT